MRQFRMHGSGDGNPFKQLRQQFDCVNLQQVIDRARIGNDDRHAGSKTESAEISPVLLKVRGRVGAKDFVSLEECIKLDARFKTEQPPQLRLRQATALVFLDSERFERPTRQVAPRSCKALSNIIRDFDD
jgi:hypothetical protein